MFVEVKLELELELEPGEAGSNRGKRRDREELGRNDGLQSGLRVLVGCAHGELLRGWREPDALGAGGGGGLAGG
jgi:hypothetical protein